jgi:hypothetical protein
MTVAPEVTTTDVAISATGNVSRTQRPAAIVRHFGKISAKSAAHVVATTAMWLIVLTVMTAV